MKTINRNIIVHSSYILITGLWPLVDINSFMTVTGYKTDIWLVKTIGAILLPVSLTMCSFLIFPTDKRPLFILAIGTALALMTIDIYYSLKGTISRIYLVDAAIELTLALAWVIASRKYMQSSDDN